MDRKIQITEEIDRRELFGNLDVNLEYIKANTWKEPLERIRNFEEFKLPLKKAERQTQAARCMNCGVPFCQSGENFGGMFSGCPLHPPNNHLLGMVLSIPEKTKNKGKVK